MNNSNAGKVLIVMLKGWVNKDDMLAKKQLHGEIPKAFQEFVEDTFSNAIFCIPSVDMSMFSTADPDEISRSVIKEIDDKCTKEEPERIIIIAYSAGTLIARSLLCLAWGATEDARIDQGKIRPWAAKIERIVMIASITRGWSISTATPAKERFFYPILILLTKCIAVIRGGYPFILKLKRNEPFVIKTRLQQIALEQYLEDESKNNRAEAKLPLIISILGSLDQFTSPADCIEMTSSKSFVFMEAPFSNHETILDLRQESSESWERKEFFRLAFTQSYNELHAYPKAVIDIDDVNDYVDSLDRPKDSTESNGAQGINDAVLVLHGIRDEGFWAKRVAREIKRLGDRTKVRAPSPSYGFFSMWDFIRPRRRREQTLWLMEQYTEIRDHYRDADISFVGHSNGTYLAKEAMKICPAIKFKRVVFAGSVVRTDFEWGTVANQVGRLINIMAANDMVVALLPGSMERLGLRFFDVGGGGFRGFLKGSSPNPKDLINSEEPFLNLGPIKGGHSAALGERYWHSIASFVVHGTIPKFPTEKRRSFERYGPIILIVSAVFLVGLLFVTINCCTNWFWLGGWVAALTTLALVWLIRRFVRSF